MTFSEKSDRLFKLENQNIIYFANDYQTDNKTSSHQNAKILNEKNTIFYIESPGLRRIRIEKHDLNRIISKLKMFFKGTKKISDNLFLYTLIFLPVRNRILKKLSLFISIVALKYYLKKNKITNPILWLTVPHVEPIIEKLQKEMSVYYCVDEYTALPGVDKQQIAILEKRLIQNVDIVFVTSKSLFNTKRKIRKDIVYSPHFVDFEHFNEAVNKKFSRPQKILGLQKPIIGFVGLIEHWFDFDLMNFIASKNDQMSFVLIGRNAANFHPSLENIHLFGIVKYELLPQYLQHFDACIIPFKVNETTKYVNPIKLKEYLATGKPVVSTFMPELSDYKDIIEISGVGNYADFNQKLLKVLSNDSESGKALRISRVQDHDWSKKISFFEKTFNEYFSKKK